ncbi:MAG: response regulator [bacterium]|nr:response regulator [bacterium]
MAGELILIVEDDPRSRRLVRDVLEYRGFRTAEATAGDEGVRLAKTLGPSLILMDLQLPRLDGIAALRLLRADPATRAIPVVAVTASATSAARPQVRAAGFDGHHDKPIDVKALVALVERMVAPG